MVKLPNFTASRGRLLFLALSAGLVVPSATAADLNARWAQFQKAADGKYCFHHGKKVGNQIYDGSVFVTVESNSIKIKQAGMLKMGGSVAFYAEDFTGERKGNVLLVKNDKEPSASTEFTISTKRLSGPHPVTDEKLTYGMVECKQ